jgi:predicted transcriptional regulator
MLGRRRPLATKVLPVALSPAAYARLDELARAEERDAVQQARWMLRQALGDVPPGGEMKTDAAPTETVA